MLSPTASSSIVSAVSARRRPPATWEGLFERFLRDRESQGLSPRTVEQYVLRGGEFCRWADGRRIRPDRLSTDDLVDFVAEMRARPLRSNSKARHLAPRTIHAYRRSILALIRFGEGRGALAKGQVEVPRVKVPKDRPRRLAPGDLERILAACRGSMAERDRAVVLLTVASGLRRKELVLLDWRDVEWDEQVGVVLVRAGKGDKARESYFDRRAWLALQEYRRACHLDDTGPVFPGALVAGEVRRLTPCGCSLIFTRLAKRSGVRFSCHGLRHTAGRAMVTSGLPLTAVQRALGHSNLSTTERYTSPDDVEARAAFAKASQRGGWSNG